MAYKGQSGSLVGPISTIFKASFEKDIKHDLETEAKQEHYSSNLLSQLEALKEELRPFHQFDEDPNIARNESDFESLSNIVKESSETLSNINSSFKDLIPLDKNADPEQLQAKNPFEILEIKHITKEDYEITLQSRSKEEIKDLHLLLKTSQVKIPLLSLDTLLPYLREKFSFKVPLGIFVNSGKITFVIKNEKIEIESKPFFVAEILEVKSINYVVQVKIKNNTGITIRGYLVSQQTSPIVLPPDSVEFYPVQSPSNNYFITRDQEGNNLISNEFDG